MQRRNIYLIILILVLVIGAAIGFSLYEQQQVKVHLTKANDLHTQMINIKINNSYNNVTSTDIDLLKQKDILLKNELGELRTVSNTIFTTQSQKDYINAAIEVNTINAKILVLQDEIITLIQKGKYSEALASYDNAKTQNDEAQKAANKRDSVLNTNPNDFGFEVTKL